MSEERETPESGTPESGAATEAVEVETVVESDGPEEEEKPILTPDQLRSQHPREHLGRKLEYVEGLGSKVWIWGLSYEDRRLIDQVAEGSPGNAEEKMQIWFVCYIGAVVRESDDNDSLQIWTPEVSVAHREYIGKLGNKTVEHIIRVSQALDGEKPQDAAGGIEQALDFIGEVAVKMNSCIKHLCSACNGSDDCPRKSSPECLHENSNEL